jgi:phosphogluconate dehydratase
MPELHQLTPSLGVLLDLGHRIALVTDGRMSGASGKVPAAIHLSPEAAAGGLISRLRDGDLLRLDAETGRLDALLDVRELYQRELPGGVPPGHDRGFGRELFANMRGSVTTAEQGAMTFGGPLYAQQHLATSDL